jgi:hypothetical protein
MKYRELLVLSAVVTALSTQPGRAISCSQDIDRAWAQINAKIQVRSVARRPVPQGAIALLHRQSREGSVTAAEETVVEVWLPVETAVAALSRARKADHANDRGACEEALAEAHMIGP